MKPESIEEVHETMLKTEVLQLAQGNPGLRTLLSQIEEAKEDGHNPPTALIGEFLDAVAHDQRRSETLDAAVKQRK